MLFVEAFATGVIQALNGSAFLCQNVRCQNAMFVRSITKLYVLVLFGCRVDNLKGRG